jgi:hypothetical protein
MRCFEKALDLSLKFDFVLLKKGNRRRKEKEESKRKNTKKRQLNATNSEYDCGFHS